MGRKANKRRNKTKKQQIEYFEMALTLNGHAKEQGPKRKHWSIHDLRSIKPLNSSQEELFHSWFQGCNVCAHGMAGTGKTYLALFLALSDVLTQRQQKIIIVRSAVPTRNVGFLPGTLEEKVAQYELPYHDILHDLIGRASTYQDMKDAGLIEFMTTSFVRGLTWDNTIVIVDEGQNMTFHEIDSIMTRLGENSRIIFTGDVSQSDLIDHRSEKTGIIKAIDAFEQMDEFCCIEFTEDDIVRSNFVKSWILASRKVA